MGFLATSWADRQSQMLGRPNRDGSTLWRFIITQPVPQWLIPTLLVFLGAVALLSLLSRWRLGLFAIASSVFLIIVLFSWQRSLRSSEWISYESRQDIAPRVKVQRYLIHSFGGRVAFTFNPAVWHPMFAADERARPQFAVNWSRQVYVGRPVPVGIKGSQDLPNAKPAWLRNMGFDWFYYPPVASNIAEFEDWTLVMPHWFCALLFSILPAYWFKNRLAVPLIRRKRRRCINCNYDLRATPDAAGALLDKCPDCGTPAPARKTAATNTPPLGTTAS